MGIHWLLHSSCCFLNVNTAITQQLIGTARTLEAEWLQVCREAWVQGHSKMSQVLGTLGLLDFTMLRPVLAWHAFWNLWSSISLIFPNFLGRGKPRVTETMDTESAEMGGSARIYKMQLSSTWALLQSLVLRNAEVCEMCLKYLNGFCLFSASKHLVGCSDKTECECCNGVWISSKNHWCYAVIFWEDFGGKY